METNLVIRLPIGVMADANTEFEFPIKSRYFLPNLPVEVTRWISGCMSHQQWTGENFMIQITVLDVKKTLTAELLVENTNLIFFYVLNGYFRCESKPKQRICQIRNSEFAILRAQPGRYEIRLMPGSNAYFSFCLKPELIQQLAIDYPNLLGVFHDENNYEIVEYGHGKINRLMNRILYRLKQIIPDGKITDHKVEGLLFELVELSQHQKEDQVGVPIKTTREIVQEVKQYVDFQTLEGAITVKEIADIFSLTPERLGQVFSDLFGLSLREYIVKARMNEAIRLLTIQGMSVTDAAETLGYTNPFNFSRRFKAYYGYPPSQAASIKDQID